MDKTGSKHGIRNTLQQVAEHFGDVVPNLYRTLANNPAALDGFVQLEGILEHSGCLPRDEQAIVALVVAAHTDCLYCQRVLSLEADEAGVTDHDVQTIVNKQTVRHPRYAVLVDATLRIMQKHGRLGHAERALLEERGVAFEQMLEIITIISTYSLATYANNLAQTRIDPEYRETPTSGSGE